MNRTTFPIRSLALALATAAALAAAGCTSQAETGPAMPPPPEVSVAPVLTKPVGQWDDFTGRVAAVDTVELRPRVSGYIERVAFTEGQEVRKGDLLLTIDPRRYRANLDRALAELDRARSEARLAQAQLARLQAIVSLYQALGGGWMPKVVEGPRNAL